MKQRLEHRLVLFAPLPVYQVTNSVLHPAKPANRMIPARRDGGQVGELKRHNLIPVGRDYIVPAGEKEVVLFGWHQPLTFALIAGHALIAHHRNLSTADCRGAPRVEDDSTQPACRSFAFRLAVNINVEAAYRGGFVAGIIAGVLLVSFLPLFR
ncbi:hypothetical protein, partial [Caballeronia sp.]|uniref:hypothetical protein n=1 Tax=Caballeronia sp. TaxID=1931223 RepID=UPI003C320B05